MEKYKLNRRDRTLNALDDFMNSRKTIDMDEFAKHIEKFVIKEIKHSRTKKERKR
jgi:hypothetical protein